MHGSPIAAEPLTQSQCVALLSRDSAAAPLREAAAQNLASATLRSVDARDRRAATETALEAGSRSSTEAATRLCAALVVERVESPVLLTGYYRPVVPARRAREEGFRYPLYALPEPALRSYSRAEIDKGALDGRVPVIAWVSEPVEAFFIHVQGSAVLAMPDGRMAIGYAGSNGRPYTSIGAVLIARGTLKRDEMSMDALKTYLRDHPDERDAVLHANERYIYFQQVEDAAIGSLGVPLTDGRSVAADPESYPPGSLLFIEPMGAAGPAPRLVFAQDRGSAITGRSRLDLYLGTGDEAGRVAGGLKQPVTVYVLRPR